MKNYMPTRRFHFLKEARQVHTSDIFPHQCPLINQMSYGATKLVGVLGPGGQLKKNNPDLCGNSTLGSAGLAFNAGL